MDWNYMGELALSILIFAPGLVILSMALLIGVLMALEKMGAFGARSAEKKAEEVAAKPDDARSVRAA